MRRKLAALLSTAAVALVAATPILAHQGHESCAGGAPNAAAEAGAPPPGPTFGTTFVSPIAQSGNAAETVAVIHAIPTVCEPHAPGE